ncbi:hypothetical protein D9M69_624270 [compost metagenome]
MQVEAAFERNLPDLELAHLAFLHAIAGPHQLVFRADVDDELIGQPVDGGGFGAHGGRLTQLGNLRAVSLGFAGFGAIVLDRLDALDRAFEQGKIVVLHVSLREGRPVYPTRSESGATKTRAMPGSVVFFHQVRGHGQLPRLPRATTATAP